MGKSVIRVVAAVIERDGRYLLTQRKKTAVLPLLWEFPGGKVEDDESEQDALLREVIHRIGVEVEIGDRIGEHFHEYSAYDVHMSLYACKLPDGAKPEPVGVNEISWAASNELEKYEFPPADQKTMDRLLGMTN
ncbi:MAG: (deoxy)nucleoside triphosphate pyrophosphohydrolase [Deltaproteobacteria bacterium]|nr:(deoxy)nucleoside triphosphate pyrophosphohydrolase [Deltaproteobacteria bacterium]